MDTWPPPTDPAEDPLDAVHLGPESVRRYLARHGLQARHELGQNHLVDGPTLEAIVAAAAPAPGRRVVEVGPGLGILTAALLRRGAAVTAVEYDARLAAHLRDRFAPALARAAGDPGTPAGLRLFEADVLDLDIDGLVTPPYDLVANLPYHITSPVFHRFLGADARPGRLVLMLQREVAERVASPPGGMSYLSVFDHNQPPHHNARVVPATAFEPAPQVDSAVLVGAVLPRRLTAAAESDLWGVVQAAFRERRKMLHNVLGRQLPPALRPRVPAALAAAGIAGDRRPQTLALDEWLALAAALVPR